MDPHPPHPGPGHLEHDRQVRGLALADRSRPGVVGQQGPEEGLAARAHQQRVAQRPQRVEVAQQLPAVRGGLGEAQAGVEHDPVVGDAGRADRLHPLLQLAADRGHHAPGAVVEREVTHPVAVGTPVHRHVRRSRVGHHVQHGGVGEPPGDVVDHDRTGLQGGLGHLVAHRVDRDQRPRGGQLADHRHHAGQLLGDQGPGRPGAGRLAADVEQVGALLEQLEAVGDRVGGGGVPAAVGEGVGGDVDDAHHARAPERHGQGGVHRLSGGWCRG